MGTFNWERIKKEDTYIRQSRISISLHEKMARQLPSHKQLLLLKKLNYTGIQPSSKLHASRIIEAHIINKHSYM